jgi:DNA polymerase
MKIGPCTVTKGKIELPNGMYIHYPNVTQDAGGEWWYDYRGVPKKLYGGIIVENIVQALARIILVTAELRLAKHGYNAAMSVHDELIYAIPEAKAELFALALKAALIHEVSWMPNIPLDAEVDIGTRYSEAK